MSAEEARQRAILLGKRICEHIPRIEQGLPATGEFLFRQIRQTLLNAVNLRLLKTSQQDVFKLLKSAKSDDGFVIIGGGNRSGGSQKDLKRQNQAVWFKRDDGALFTFTITVIEQKAALFLCAYDFELWIPENTSPVFIRFDLNKPNHDNEKDGMRSHLHPGHDDLSVPAPLIGPIEALEMLIYSPDLRFPERQRSQPNAARNFASEVTAYLAQNQGEPFIEGLSQQTQQNIDKLRNILSSARGPAITPSQLAMFILDKQTELLVQELSEEEY